MADLEQSTFSQCRGQRLVYIEFIWIDKTKATHGGKDRNRWFVEESVQMAQPTKHVKTCSKSQKKVGSKISYTH